jgi:hypothetical protein
MSHEVKNCAFCNGPLIEIDHYGERLVGCATCNLWKWRGGKSLTVVLPQSDLDALRGLIKWSASASSSTTTPGKPSKR